MYNILVVSRYLSVHDSLFRQGGKSHDYLFFLSKKSQKSQVVFLFEEFTPEKFGFMIHVVMWYHHHFQTA